jgi:hypothetical protein
MTMTYRTAYPGSYRSNLTTMKDSSTPCPTWPEATAPSTWRTLSQQCERREEDDKEEGGDDNEKRRRAHAMQFAASNPTRVKAAKLHTQLPGACTQLPGACTQLPGACTQLPGASSALLVLTCIPSLLRW